MIACSERALRGRPGARLSGSAAAVVVMLVILRYSRHLGQLRPMVVVAGSRPVDPPVGAGPSAGRWDDRTDGALRRGSHASTTRSPSTPTAAATIAVRCIASTNAAFAGAISACPAGPSASATP